MDSGQNECGGESSACLRRLAGSQLGMEVVANNVSTDISLWRELWRPARLEIEAPAENNKR